MIKRTICLLFFTWFQLIVIFTGNAQIMGYPLPGNTQYPDIDGRRAGRIIPDNDRAFKSVIADDTTNTAYLVSGNLNIPWLVRFDLLSFTKTGRLILDCGLPAVRSGWFDSRTRYLWLGTQGYFIVVDADRLEVVRFIPVGDVSIETILWNSVSGNILALAKGYQDGLLEVNPETNSVYFTPVEGFSNSFQHAVMCTEQQRLLILAVSEQSHVIAVDLQTNGIEALVRVPGHYPASTFALNTPRNELYVASTGTPSRIYRFDYPDLEFTGSIDLPSDERPGGFMFCHDNGSYLFVNDADASSGLIRINTLLFERKDRLNYGDFPFPSSFSHHNGSIVVATENTPGAILKIDPHVFEITRQAVFNDCATNAGLLFESEQTQSVYAVVSNLGKTRLIGFDPVSARIEQHIDLPMVTGKITAAAENNGTAYLLECDSTTAIVVVDCPGGTMSDRRSIADDITCRDMIRCPDTGRLYVLTTHSILAVCTDTLTVADFIEFDSELTPATGFTFDESSASLFVGGKLNSGKVWQFLTEPLELVTTIELEPGDSHALHLETDSKKSDTFWAVRAQPFMLRRYDTATDDFTGHLTFPFNGHVMENMWFSPYLNQLLLLQRNAPFRLHRIDTGLFEWKTPLDFFPGETVVNGFTSAIKPYAFFSISGLCATIARYGSTQAHSIHGSRATLDEMSCIESVNLYSHEAGNRIRLAVYDDSYTLLWESGSIVNTVVNDWLKVSVENGTPAGLTLPPGEYILAFQVTGDGHTPSVTPFWTGAGITFPWPFGTFPSHLITPGQTDIVWSLYADTIPVSPTPTPTPDNTATPSATPDATSTPTPAGSATSTPTTLPTFSPAPTYTPQITPTPMPTNTPTPRPGSGVELMLSQNCFYPGDSFHLDARMANTEPSPVNVELYIILDVYGQYWFGPSWSNAVDAFQIDGLLGVRIRDVFSFVWPETDGSAEGILFWGGMIQQDQNTIFGYFDRVEFEYRESPDTPVPTPPSTPVPTSTATPAPTYTPNDSDSIETEFNMDDPMNYSGQQCDTADVFCFAPERVNFCSDWSDIAYLTNTGNHAATVSVSLNGSNTNDFEIKHSILTIPPGETYNITVRFCPKTPPDQLKTAFVIAEWNGDSAQMEIKGWCVAG